MTAIVTDVNEQHQTQHRHRDASTETVAAAAPNHSPTTTASARNRRNNNKDGKNNDDLSVINRIAILLLLALIVLVNSSMQPIMSTPQQQGHDGAPKNQPPSSALETVTTTNNNRRPTLSLDGEVQDPNHGYKNDDDATPKQSSEQVLDTLEALPPTLEPSTLTPPPPPLTRAPQPPKQRHNTRRLDTNRRPTIPRDVDDESTKPNEVDAVDELLPSKSASSVPLAEATEKNQEPPRHRAPGRLRGAQIPAHAPPGSPSQEERMRRKQQQVATSQQKAPSVPQRRGVLSTRPPKRPGTPAVPPTKPTAPPKVVPTPLYKQVVHERCQCKEPFVQQYEAMLKAGLTTTPAPAPTETTEPDETATPAPTKRPVGAPQRRPRDALPAWKQPGSRPAANTGSPSPQFWKPESYGIKHPIRRFLRKWFWEVMQHRERAGSGDASSSTPPEARILLIGDSLNRNMFYSMIVQTVEEGLGKEDSFGTFARHIVKDDSETYQFFYLTWPSNNKATNGSATDAGVATIKIRTEQQIYFGMDTHSLKSSRGLEFNPTHVFVSRGFWDLVHAEPHDPSIAIASLSAGLVRLRKELADHREELPVEQRNLYPPARVVYVALPKVFKSNEPFSKAKSCAHNHDQMIYRDAFYAAVRRANGALLHQHGKENFNSVAIELFDYYAMSMAAGAGNTNGGDGRHPKPPVRLAILSQMLDLVAQPPRSQESVQQLIDDAQANNRVFLNATMYIPPPLTVRPGRSDASNSSCPLSFTRQDVRTIEQPPKIGGYGAEAAFTREVEDLTPPPIVLGPGLVQLFVGNMVCQSEINSDWSVVAKVGAMLPRMAAAASPPKAVAVVDDEREPLNAEAPVTKASPTRPPSHTKRPVDAISACANLLVASVFRFQSLMPLYKSATPPSSPNATMADKALWYGNRCLHFINSEIAARGGPEAYYNQLWDYTDSSKLMCVIPTYIAYFTWQPVQQSLTSEAGDDGDRLARCAAVHGGVRVRRRQ